MAPERLCNGGALLTGFVHFGDLLMMRPALVELRV